MMAAKTWPCTVLWIAGFTLSLGALAAPLPQPLSLQHALTLAADENHYDLQLRAADMDAARAGLRTAQGENDLLCQSASKFDHPTASNFDQGFMLISCAV